MKVSLNDTVWIKPTEQAIEEIRARWEAVCERFGGPLSEAVLNAGVPEPDAAGWIRLPLWAAFEDYGPLMGISRPSPFYGGAIYTERPEGEDS